MIPLMPAFSMRCRARMVVPWGEVKYLRPSVILKKLFHVHALFLKNGIVLHRNIVNTKGKSIIISNYYLPPGEVTSSLN